MYDHILISCFLIHYLLTYCNFVQEADNNKPLVHCGGSENNNNNKNDFFMAIDRCRCDFRLVVAITNSNNNGNNSNNNKGNKKKHIKHCISFVAKCVAISCFIRGKYISL